MNWIMHWSIGGRWLFGGLLWWNGLSLTLGSVFIGSGITSTSGSGPLVLILGSGKKIGNPIVWIHTFFWSLTYAHNNFFTVFLNLLFLNIYDLLFKIFVSVFTFMKNVMYLVSSFWFSNYHVMTLNPSFYLVAKIEEKTTSQRSQCTRFSVQ